MSAKLFFSLKVKRWVAASLPICLTALRTTSRISSSACATVVSSLRGGMVDTMVSWCLGIVVSGLGALALLFHVLLRGRRRLLGRAQQGFVEAGKGTGRFIGHRPPSSAMRYDSLPCAS